MRLKSLQGVPIARHAVLSVSYITATLYCICLSACFMFASADAVQICGKFRDTQSEPKARAADPSKIEFLLQYLLTKVIKQYNILILLTFMSKEVNFMRSKL